MEYQRSGQFAIVSEAGVFAGAGGQYQPLLCECAHAEHGVPYRPLM